MALTFPLAVATLADRLQIQTAPWQLVEQQELSGLGSGELLAADLGPALWSADVSTIPMLHTQARRRQGLIEAMIARLEAFYLYNPAGAFPAADPGGTLVAGSTVKIHTVGGDNRSLRLKGLPSTYVLTEGDLLAFNYGSPARRAMHRVLETVTAVSGTTPSFEVVPHLRPGTAVDDIVVLSKPAAKVKIVPGSLDVEPAGTNRARLRFRVRQTLRAG